MVHCILKRSLHGTAEPVSPTLLILPTRSHAAPRAVLGLLVLTPDTATCASILGARILGTAYDVTGVADVHCWDCLRLLLITVKGPIVIWKAQNERELRPQACV